LVKLYHYVAAVDVEKKKTKEAWADGGKFGETLRVEEAEAAAARETLAVGAVQLASRCDS
jgi:hypothetical protein